MRNVAVSAPDTEDPFFGVWYGKGETFRGCETLDEAFACIRAHAEPRASLSESKVQDG